jgi:hypothetical protein
LHILQVDLECVEIRRREFSGKLHLCAKNRRVVDSAMQGLGLRITHDLERFREEKRVRDQHFFHFAPLHVTIGHGGVLHRFEFVLERNAEHRADDALLLAPRIGDLADRFVPALEPVAHYVPDHRQRDQHHENERADSKEFDGCAVALQKVRLRFWRRQQRLCFRRGGRLNGGNRLGNQSRARVVI